MKSTFQIALLGVLCGTTAFAAMPPEAFAMSAASPAVVGLAAPVAKVWHRSGCRPYAVSRAYYPRYGYGYYRPRTVYYSYRHPAYAGGYSYGYPSYGGGYSYPSYGYGYNSGGAIAAGAALGLMGAGVSAASRPHWGGGWGYRRWGW